MNKIHFVGIKIPVFSMAYLRLYRPITASTEVFLATPFYPILTYFHFWFLGT